eukprot:scaffold141856_cov32-Tisochrysis_lutea.AAC.1
MGFHHAPALPLCAAAAIAGWTDAVSAPSTGTGASTNSTPPAMRRSYMVVAQPGHTSRLSSHAIAIPRRSRTIPSSRRPGWSHSASPATYSAIARLRKWAAVGAHGYSYSISPSRDWPTAMRGGQATPRAR